MKTKKLIFKLITLIFLSVTVLLSCTGHKIVPSDSEKSAVGSKTKSLDSKKTSDPRILTSLISIKQKDKTYPLTNTNYIYLDDYKFDICFDNISKEESVCLFAYWNADYKNKYSLPIHADDTEIFYSACAMAENPLNKTNGYSLSITTPHSFHYITDDRRINNQNNTVLPVTNITDSTGNFTDRAVLSFFVDFNKDNIIEENEYASVELIFMTSVTFGELDFSENNRSYFSTNGTSSQDPNYNITDFLYYKINSKDEYKSMLKELEPYFNISYTYLTTYRYFENDNEDFLPQYFIFIPSKYTTCGNGFMIKGSKTIYFEIKDYEGEKSHTTIRHFHINKNRNYDRIALYYNGKVIPLTEKK